LNLRLEILDKRKDGYHEIRTLFQKIDLCDTLRFSLVKERGIFLSTDHAGLPVDKNNLICKAAQLILDNTDSREGVSIHLAKRIPLGAGLGGGSSNAAATLKALNALLRTGLSGREMMEMGGRIGADVPFFFLGCGAIGTGIGERLQEVRLPDLEYILLYPNFEVSTRWAYENFRLTKTKNHLNIHKFLATPEEISQILMNDLEEVVSARYPQIRQMKNALTSTGALGSLMTGSGPSVFGLFSEKADADKAYRLVKKMKESGGWTVLKTRSLPSEEGNV
jgi:4-diphosphocytidyl-2-C-methyl-D-erythritol kinase